MVIMHVHIHVKPECIEEFKAATLINAMNSVREEGIARFDILQSPEDPTRFVLSEAYHSEHAIDAHKTTAHYHSWVEKVSDMLAEPRTRSLYKNVFPEDHDW